MIPKLSVVIPVFGHAPYLKACRDALAAQTFQDFEVIECAPLLDGPQNAGAARNVGLARAVGDWIAFVDADDLPMPEMLEASIAAGEANKADVVVFDAVEFDDKTGFETSLPQRSGFLTIRSFTIRWRIQSIRTVTIWRPNVSLNSSLRA